MEQIMIIKPNGTKYPLASKRTATTIKSAKQTISLLGDDVIDVSVVSAFPQIFEIGDKIVAFGRTYTLNQLPDVKKTGAHGFSYDMQFEGVQYDLLRIIYDLTVETTGNTLQDVQADSLTGDLSRFATVLVANANRIFPGEWVLGACPDSDTRTLTFNESDNCLSVLQNLCSENNFDVEFEIEQHNGVKTINLVEKVGQIFPYTFEFGKGKGIYALDRKNVSSASIITRLKVQGSSSNITSKYRAQRLCLPGKSKAQSYIEDASAIAKYGVIEGKKNFDDIKPTFDGNVTAKQDDNQLKFVDMNMFDINELEEDGKTTKYLMSGVSAKVHFNTGNLAGYEFEVHEYDHKTHTFTLKKLSDDRGNIFPSDSSMAFQFAVGDKYKLLDVALPDTYEQAAENELLQEATNYYEQNCQPQVQYGLSITSTFLEKMVGNGSTVNIFSPGDYIPIKDDDINVDKSIRIKSLTRNLLDEYEYTLTISDTVTTTITNRVISDLVKIDKIIEINQLDDPARSKSNWRTNNELLNMIFDPDGDYYTDKIKPNSIETMALSVGAKSMQFCLVNTIFEPNFNGNINFIKVTGGTLTHYAIENNIRIWNLADNTTTLDSSNQAYYIYAKCLKSGTSGMIIFDNEQIKVDSDINYYYFLIGVLNSVDEQLNARSISLSYGFTTINGRFLKTGRIESNDGYTYFDLDNSEICGNIKFLTNDGMEKNVSELQKEIGEIAVGCENLFDDSDFSFGNNTFRCGSCTATIDSYADFIKSYNGLSLFFHNKHYIGKLDSYFYISQNIKIDNSQNYSLSFMYANTGSIKVSSSFLACYNSSGNIVKHLIINHKTSTDCLWVKHTQTFKFDSNVQSIEIRFGFKSDGQYCEMGVDQIKFERGILVTDWSPSINDVNLATKYLKDALTSDTTIAGGLILSSLIMLKNKNGRINAGINGIDNTIDGNSPALWFGGDYQAALNNNVTSIIKQNGSGSFADGKMWWDNLGKFGVGIFNVSDDAITVDVDNGMKIQITNKTIGEYDNYDIYSKYNFQLNYLAGDNDGTLSFSNYNINIPLQKGKLYNYNFENIRIVCDASLATSSLFAGWSTASYKIQIKDNTTKTLYSGVAKNTDSLSLSKTFSGQYTPTTDDAEFIISFYGMRAYRGTIDISIDRYYIGAEDDFFKCIIAKDGLMISSGSNKRFIVKPDSDALTLIQDLPSYSSKLDTGQLFVDDAGFVRQKRYNDDSNNNIMKVTPTASTRGTLDLSSFYKVILPS